MLNLLSIIEEAPKLKVPCPRSSINRLVAEAKTEPQGTISSVAFLYTQGAWELEDFDPKLLS